MTGPHIVMEMEDAAIFYNGKPILDRVSCAFRANAVTGLVGPSGSGKTTLLRTLSRLNDRIDGFRVEGRVHVVGQEIYGNGVDVYHLRRQVGMIFQKPVVFPKSIYENTVFGLKHLAPQRKREFPGVAERVLKEVLLWEEVKDRLHKPAPTLSQGQQQRLAIARTLAVDPEILLLDEPTSSLDPRSSAAIEDLIVSLKARHTLVLVTHNLAQARRVCDDLVFLRDGTVWEQGSCREIFANPEKKETRDYLTRRDGDEPT
ncbi:hypothetical protein UR09_00230 [Candidatus Nitromaritima sp. SCGC AAA799-A02]|nr:hypothetical protein UZ36_00225 [Candidatus Nitromaritima sp. SCGC AAA799-C22]KMP12747.1 hypothetical protein UR09_00230 [Candidatus Nitromaritima sp. SCGC AAA799-A02]